MHLMFGLILLLLVAPVHAELVDNGAYTTDTVSGLDWLDLSETSGIAWSEALVEKSGWRHATLTEVTGLFEQAFVEFDTSKSKSEAGRGDYPAQLDDVRAFIRLFGLTYSGKEKISFGFYKAHEGVLTIMGAREDPADVRRPVYHVIIGMMFRPYDAYSETEPLAHIGVFMVRQSVK